MYKNEFFLKYINVMDKILWKCWIIKSSQPCAVEYYNTESKYRQHFFLIPSKELKKIIKTLNVYKRKKTKPIFYKKDEKSKNNKSKMKNMMWKDTKKLNKDTVREC